MKYQLLVGTVYPEVDAAATARKTDPHVNQSWWN
jgi:hypothetical protein